MLAFLRIELCFLGNYAFLRIELSIENLSNIFSEDIWQPCDKRMFTISGFMISDPDCNWILEIMFSLATQECVRNVTKIPFSKFALTLSIDPLFDSAQLSEYC